MTIIVDASLLCRGAVLEMLIHRVQLAGAPLHSCGLYDYLSLLLAAAATGEIVQTPDMRPGC